MSSPSIIQKSNKIFKNNISKEPFIKYKLSKSILLKEANKKYYNYTYINTTYLIFNEKCEIVSRFKDYLIFDDTTEFLKAFYSYKEVIPRLKKIYNFYEKYSKIFPNYMILPESNYLYRNIRKKQKMIDEFNEIRREEEENRKNLKLEKKNTSNKKSNNEKIFDKSIQESINRYQPSLINDDSKSTISISLYNKPFNNINNGFITPNSSFRDENNDTTTIASIESIVINLNKNFDYLKNNLLETPKKANSNKKNNHIEQQNALNNNKKFFGHKFAVSFIPEVKKFDNNNNKSDNLKSKILQGTEINKKRNLNLGFKYDFHNHLNKSPKNERLNTISTSTIEKNKKPIKKEEKNYFKRETKTKKSEFKSPNSKNISKNTNKISLLPKRPITTTIKSSNHFMPIYKNKINNKIIDMNNFSASNNKVNCLKTKLEKKKPNNNCNNIFKKHNTMKSLGNILDKKIILNSFISIHKKEKKNNNNENNKENKDYSNQKDKSNESSKNKNLNTNCKKNLYKNYIEKNKNNRNSYEPSHKNKIKKKDENNNLSINSNLLSNVKIHNLKTPSIDKKNLFSPHHLKVPFSAVQYRIKVDKNLFNKESYERENNLIKNINFKNIDINTKKMKFIKKLK